MFILYCCSRCRGRGTYVHDATLNARVFLRRARTTPLSEQPCCLLQIQCFSHCSRKGWGGGLPAYLSLLNSGVIIMEFRPPPFDQAKVEAQMRRYGRSFARPIKRHAPQRLDFMFANDPTASMESSPVESSLTEADIRASPRPRTSARIQWVEEPLVRCEATSCMVLFSLLFGKSRASHLPPFPRGPCQNNMRCFFRIVWNCGIWRFHFVVINEHQLFSVIWGWGWYFGDADHCLATCCRMSVCPGVQVITHGPRTEVVALPVSPHGMRK